MRLLLMTVGLVSTGCASEQISSTPAPAEVTRMEEIVELAVEQATDPLHRELLNSGEVFVDLPDMEVPCVGVKVSLPESENRAFLSFTKEWFHAHSNEEVATALLEDLGNVLSEAK